MAELDPKVRERKIIFKNQKEVTLPGVWKGKPESESMEADRLEESDKISFPKKNGRVLRQKGQDH